MNMTANCQEITVHALNFDHQGGPPVFYASLPCPLDMVKGHRTNSSVEKHRLVSRLWDYVGMMETPSWKCFDFSRSASFPLHVVHSPLGRPHLLLGEYRCPAISFTESGGNVWAALSGDHSDIGIDVARTDEFLKGYPFHRVFNDRELQHALSLAAGDLGSASALLWSIKEAVVKALGCGFHLVDPLQINVYPPVSGENRGYTFPVRLLKKTRFWFSTHTGRSIWVRSLPLAEMWLSITRLKIMNNE